MNQGPRWTLLMKKTRAVKSRATVPLCLLHYAAVRFDSPLQNTAARFDSLLQDAAASHIFPLQNAVGKFDSPLHHAAGRFLQKSSS